MSRDNVPASPAAETDAFTDVQSAIAEIWAEVLQCDTIGIDDDFIKLGGDSLQATLVMSRLCRRLDISLPGSTLFAARTLRKLAERVEQIRASTGVPAAASGS